MKKENGQRDCVPNKQKKLWITLFVLLSFHTHDMSGLNMHHKGKLNIHALFLLVSKIEIHYFRMRECCRQ